MNRYGHSTPLLHFCLFFFFLLCSVVFSELPSNQKTTMINLSKALVNNTALKWDVTKDPCLWRGVKCISTPGNSSITEISLSGVSLSSSDFLPLLCQIDSLVSLDLSNNSLTSIPDKFIIDCGAIGGLQLLNISRNMLGWYSAYFSWFCWVEVLGLVFQFFEWKHKFTVRRIGCPQKFES
jgi:hypothetical protein